MCEIIHDNKITKTLKSIPVSNDTNKSKIDSIEDKLNLNYYFLIKKSDTFTIQLVEFTDIKN